MNNTIIHDGRKYTLSSFKVGDYVVNTTRDSNKKIFRLVPTTSEIYEKLSISCVNDTPNNYRLATIEEIIVHLSEIAISKGYMGNFTYFDINDMLACDSKIIYNKGIWIDKSPLKNEALFKPDQATIDWLNNRLYEKIIYDKATNRVFIDRLC